MLIGTAGLVRPEFGLVFATLVVVPIAARQYRSAFLFLSAAAGPALMQTLTSEVFGQRAYISIQLFASRPVVDVAFSDSGPTVYWGLGIWPWIGAAAAGVLIYAGGRRVALLSAGRLLILGWVGWSLAFAWFAPRGAIPTQIRTYLALHVLGALALAVAGHEVLDGKPWAIRIVAGCAAMSVILAMVVASDNRADWQATYPKDVQAVTALMVESGGGRVLTDWMWWREWTVGVYASEPGGDICNYGLCTTRTDSSPPANLTSGLTEVEANRLTRAWQYVNEAPPRFIVMFDDETYVKWRAWEKVGNPEVLSSFVRPLLRSDGSCFMTVVGLPSVKYCPVLATGRYVVLERS